MKTLVAAALAIGGAHAFWRLECHGRSGLARIDPLVNPGVPSFHLHSVHGSSAFGMSVNNEDLRNGECTSCEVVQDKSAYWTPALFFLDAATGKYETVGQVGGILAYYLQNPNPGESTVKAFPRGFRMIAGNAKRKEYTAGDYTQPDPPKSNWAGLGQTTQEILAQRAIGVNCLNYGAAPEPSLWRHYLPEKGYLDQHCTDGIRFELMFPSCWDGQNTDSPNHMDHMAYPDLVMDGQCPPSHPIKTVGLFYEVIWNTAAFSGRNGKFVLATDDDTGFSYHGDFMEGWVGDGFLDAAVAKCTNPSGRIQDCPLFTLQEQSVSAQCQFKIPGLLANEKVTGPLDSLPGIGASANLAVDVAPGLDLGQSPQPNGNAAQPAPAAPSAAAAPPPPPEPTQPAPATVAPPPPPPPPEPTTTAAPGPSKEPGVDYQTVSTEYRTRGNRVEVIFWEAAIQYVTEDVTATVTVTQSTPKMIKREVHRHHHLNSHRKRHH